MTDKEAMRLAAQEKRLQKEADRQRDIAKALKLAREEGLTAGLIGQRLSRTESWVLNNLKGLHRLKHQSHVLANGLPAVGQ